MSMIIADARRSPRSRTRSLHLPAHGVAVDAARVLRVADREADFFALEPPVADRRAVHRAGEHLEALLEAQRALRQAPVPAHLRRRIVQVRGAPVAAFAGGLLGDVGAP